MVLRFPTSSSKVSFIRHYSLPLNLKLPSKISSSHSKNSNLPRFLPHPFSSPLHSFPSQPTVPWNFLSLLGIQPTSERPSLYLVFTVITGLPLALWAYKCLMLVIFQRKIIYMGYAPLGARKEELDSVPPRYLRGLRCEEIKIPSSDRVTLSGIVVSREEKGSAKEPKGVIVYFQGNAGNPLHRIPVFQTLLHPAYGHRHPIDPLAIVSVAPRSYWKSTPRAPSENGLMMDYHHVIRYSLERFPNSKLILYGHSLGGAAAVCLSSRLVIPSHHGSPERSDAFVDPRYANIEGIILENPFASIPGMVRALYPERWIPYRYLAPLALDKWDAVTAMRQLSTTSGVQSYPASQGTSVLRRLARDMLFVLSEKDEVVPVEMGTSLFEEAMKCPEAYSHSLGRKIVIAGSLHENAWQHRQWSREMDVYLGQVLQREGIR